VRADQRCCHRHFFNAACQFSTRLKGLFCSAGAENSGLARLVDLKKDHFIGRSALEEEQRRGPKRLLTGFDINWDDVERLYDAIGLAPQVPSMASRMAVPVYRGGFQVGKSGFDDLVAVTGTNDRTRERQPGTRSARHRASHGTHNRSSTPQSARDDQRIAVLQSASKNSDSYRLGQPRLSIATCQPRRW
jgi:hypothetical protein